jgi:exopolysaccharide biosynthesis protein
MTWVGLCIAALCALATGCAHLGENKQSPFPGIVLRFETETNVRPIRLYIAEIDLKNPRIHVRVAPGGPDPDGPGQWQTILTKPTEIAAREHFDLVMNGGFFASRRVKNPNGTNTLPDPLRWGAAQDLAMTHGIVWSTGTNARPCLIVHKDKSVAIKMIRQPTSNDWEALAGNVMLLRNGAVVLHSETNLHPRTCVGLNANRTKLVLLVVDGRQPGFSMGMTYNELARTMRRLGCSDAFNLDGGGSAMMAVRNAALGDYQILNKPSDGQERPVADVLGVSVDFPSGPRASKE